MLYLELTVVGGLIIALESPYKCREKGNLSFSEEYRIQKGRVRAYGENCVEIIKSSLEEV